MAETIVVALGGNAIKGAKETGTYQEQLHNISQTAAHLADLVIQGHRLLISHGNGPQVGNLLIQHAAAASQVPALPMDVCGTQSQGQIGYMIQQELQNHLRERHHPASVVTLITQVEVDAQDPAFAHPTKPVGPFYDQAWAESAKKSGLAVIEDAGRGYRRVVPSPKPKAIIELEAIKQLLSQGVIVIASGGGGIPVINVQGQFRGVEAVIDKDLASEVLAEHVDADRFIILTEVEAISLNYGKPNAKTISSMTPNQARTYIQAGHFAPGSMLPKVEAAIAFVEHSGKEAIVTHPFKVLEAMQGTIGTRIVAN